MKKICFLLLMITACQITIAQNVGIGTTTPNVSAQLDVTSTTKGLLIPRMNKPQRNAIAAPATGLLVFQDAPDSTGFYYYDGLQWKWLVAADNTIADGWRTDGNMSTNPATNFIGTKDNQPLRFRINNINAGKLDTLTNNTSFGFRSLDSVAATEGQFNTAFGYKTLSNTISGTNNTAVGGNALRNNKIATGNTAIGYGGLQLNRNSSYNTAIGNLALASHRFTGAAYNTAVGVSALEQDSIGFQNTAVGTSSFRFNKESPYNSGLGINSGYYQLGSDNTFIGAYTGFGQRINAANISADTGFKNTGLGAGALYRLANGNYNVALGQDALLFDSSGSYNVAVGHNSLPAITSGSYNSSLGYNTNAGAGTLINTTTIGSHAYVTQSNSLILGSIDGVNGATADTKVGIGITAPLASLHVAKGAVVFSTEGLPLSPSSAGDPPVSGTGRRMMWYPDKAAFRVGYASGTSWNKENTGTYSFAAGENTIANGLNSVALGRETFAGAQSSTAMGIGTTASGNFSTATGSNTTASGWYSTAMGRRTVAAASNSTTIGTSTISFGYSGTAIGMYNDSILALPQEAVTPTTPLFIIGNGDDENVRSNAMIVRKDGNVGIGTDNPNTDALLHISSTNKGVLFPRMTTSQRIAITTPPDGLMVYDTDKDELHHYDGGNWRAIINSKYWSRPISNRNIVANTVDSVAIGTSLPAARLDVNGDFKLGNNGTVLAEIIKSSEAYDIPSLAPGAVDIQTFAVPNAGITSAVSISPSFPLPDGITISYARVSAAGIVEVKVVNAGNITQNPTNMSFILVIIK
ncbi:MAG: hypothetical protein JNM19_06535 [Chitinophagaceae bacterium]|nr:hypothetical protein [Chitinophagaceae bacterium]